MSAALFRDYYWKPALRRFGIDADPHQARHWFVTNALRNIDRSSTEGPERTRRRQELIQYMSWRSGERTLSAYDHVQRAVDFRGRLEAIHREMRRRELCVSRDAQDGTSLPFRDIQTDGQELSRDLAFVLGEDS